MRLRNCYCYDMESKAADSTKKQDIDGLKDLRQFLFDFVKVCGSKNGFSKAKSPDGIKECLSKLRDQFTSRMNKDVEDKMTNLKTQVLSKDGEEFLEFLSNGLLSQISYHRIL